MALAQYSDTFWFPSGALAASIPARVFEPSANTLATLYTDAGGTTTLTQPLTTTSAGLLTFWAEEGEYWLHLDTESFLIGVGAAAQAATEGDITTAVTTHSAATDPHGDRAYADTVAATQAAAWRRRDMPDLAIVDAPYEGPVVTGITQSASPTISGAVTYAPDTGPFLYLGADDFEFGPVFPDTNYYLPTSRYPHTYSSGQSNWSVEFWTDTEEFEVGFKHISAATMYRLSIDGRKVTDLMQSAGGITPGSAHMLNINLGSATPRRIRIDFTTMPFRGVYLPPTATMWQPVARGGRLAVLGDSLTDGSSQNTGFGQGTWLARTARLIGTTDPWDQARGGTGYITAGSFATFGDRVADDIVAYAPDRVIVWGGFNDSSGDQAAIGTAADAVYAAITTGLPDAEVFVIGCWSPSGSPGSGITNTDATLRTAASTAGLPFISPLTGSIYNGAGTLVATHGPWITTQNAGTYVGGDNTHPTDAGHIYLSRRIYGALLALMPD